MQPTLALKSTVTRRGNAPVPPDTKEHLQQLQHHQAAVTGDSTPVTSDGKTVTRDKPQEKRDPHGAQGAFLNANLGRAVTVYLTNGIKLTGTLRQFDQFTLLLSGDAGNNLVFKHAISTLQPGVAPRSRALGDAAPV